MKEEFSNHPFISFSYDENELPPQRYVVEYRGIKGLKLIKNEELDRKELEILDNHRIEIYLHADYPRLKPQCNIVSEIFHPNFRMASPNDICIGDYWASGETIVDIIYQIGEMIMYQSYNVTSPLNGIAAKWARENSSIFPIDKANIRQGEIDVFLHDDNEKLNIL